MLRVEGCGNEKIIEQGYVSGTHSAFSNVTTDRGVGEDLYVNKPGGSLLGMEREEDRARGDVGRRGEPGTRVRDGECDTRSVGLFMGEVGESEGSEGGGSWVLSRDIVVSLTKGFCKGWISDVISSEGTTTRREEGELPADVDCGGAGVVEDLRDRLAIGLSMKENLLPYTKSPSRNA